MRPISLKNATMANLLQIDGASLAMYRRAFASYHPSPTA
jgi:hypothetical protein